MSSMYLQDTLTTDSLEQIAAELHLGPLQEPDAVPFTFEAIGWPVLAGMVLLGMLIFIYFRIRAYRKNFYRREALAELEKVASGQLGLVHSFVLLKRTAIHAFGRKKTGGMCGLAWLQFLDKSAKGVNLVHLQEDIERLIYKEEMPAEQVKKEIITNTKKWIKNHVAR